MYNKSFKTIGEQILPLKQCSVVVENVAKASNMKRKANKITTFFKSMKCTDVILITTDSLAYNGFL